MTTLAFAGSEMSSLLTSAQFLVFTSLALGSLIALGFSLMFGHDHDADHDIDHDVADHDGDAGEHDADGEHAPSWPSFRSPKVFFAFMLGFGAAGSIATICGVGSIVASLFGIVAGLLMALFVSGLSYILIKQQVDSGLKSEQLLGASAVVTTEIPADGLGEVNVRVNGQIIPYTAVSSDGRPLNCGVEVRIVRNLGGRVSVLKSL